MIDVNRINRAKKIICTTILDQVENGAQSKELTDAFACGQFLKVASTHQRGFHGTAAAIRVLAGYHSTYNEQLRKLLQYLEKADEYDKEKDTNDGLNRDLNNIIKSAEILYSLSYIHSGTANTENLKLTISEKLYKSKNDDGGWAYFADIKEESDMYFTSSVYLALKSHNYNNLQKTRSYLVEKLRYYKKENIPDPTTFSKLCFIVYTFVKLKEYKSDKELKKLLIEVFKKLWRSEHCVINNDFEQNIEYPCKQRHYYVRIPWQLYLLSIANSLIPRYFAQRKSIERLNTILNSIIDDNGFIYKQSGKNISTRTYSKLFEVLSNIEESFKLNFKFYIFNAIDWIRTFFNSRAFKNIISIIGIIIIGFIVFKWVKDGAIDMDSIAPSIIASLLILSLQLSKTK